jgi:hypothetical protein
VRGRGGCDQADSSERGEGRREDIISHGESVDGGGRGSTKRDGNFAYLVLPLILGQLPAVDQAGYTCLDEAEVAVGIVVDLQGGLVDNTEACIRILQGDSGRNDCRMARVKKW